GRPLIDEEVEAWKYGPVVPSLYRAVKQYRSNPVEKVMGAKQRVFSPEELNVMDGVTQFYGKHTAVALSSATHRAGTPWSETWDRFSFNTAISNDLIESFYSSLLKQ